MKTPASLLEELLREVRGLFYSRLPERSWFTQQVRVKLALTLPAKWLNERGVELPAARYKAIMLDILKTIRDNGRRDVGAFPCAYLWSCVESHMRHHGEEYYQEGKGIRNRVRIFMTAVEKANKGADGTVPTLAEAHAVLEVGKRKKGRKGFAKPLQPGLFGGEL